MRLSSPRPRVSAIAADARRTSAPSWRRRRRCRPPSAPSRDARGTAASATSGSFFEQTASTMPRPVSSFSATWKSTKASPAVPPPSTMPPTPSSPITPPQSVLSRSSTSAAPRQAEPGREHRRGVARQHRQRCPARRASSPCTSRGRRTRSRVPMRAGEQRDVDEAHVLAAGPVGEVAVDARVTLRRVPSRPAAWWPSGSPPGVAKPMLHDDRRRGAGAPPPRRPTSASTSASASASGVSVNGADPERAVVGREDQRRRARAARSAEPGSSVALKYWPKSGWWMVEREAEPGGGEPQQRREGARWSRCRPARRVRRRRTPRPGLHRAAGEQARRRRPGLEARRGVDDRHQPGRRRRRPAGREMRPRELARRARRAAARSGAPPPRSALEAASKRRAAQVRLAELLERGELAVACASRPGSGLRAGVGSTDVRVIAVARPGAAAGRRCATAATATMAPAGTLVITTAFGPITTSSPIRDRPDEHGAGADLDPVAEPGRPAATGRARAAERRRWSRRGGSGSRRRSPRRWWITMPCWCAMPKRRPIRVWDRELDAVEVAHDAGEEAGGGAAAARAGPGSRGRCTRPRADRRASAWKPGVQKVHLVGRVVLADECA